jgi:preprotein translocase subunit SecD
MKFKDSWMNQYPLWRYLLVLVLLILGIIYALPNLYGDSPAIQISNASSTKISQSTIATIQTDLKAVGLTDASIETQEGAVLIRFKSTEAQLKAQDVLQNKLSSDFSIALNLAPKTPAWLRALGAEPMKLGLDLRGGIHFLMYVDISAALKQRVTGDMTSMTSFLRNERIRYRGAAVTETGLLLNFSTQASALAAQSSLSNNYSTYTYSVAPAGPGVWSLAVSMTPAEVTQFEVNIMDQTMSILSNRVNAIGVSEPVVQQQGANYISIDLPGIQDSARAKKIMGAAATVSMQLLDPANNAYTAKQTGVIPFGDKLYEFQGMPVLLKNKVVLSGTAITNASAAMDENGRPSVNISVSGGQASLLYDTTSKNLGKPMATVYIETITHVDNKNGKHIVTTDSVSRIINIATIQGAFSTQFSITGMESPQASENLALLLRSGAYPIAPAIVEEKVVGPSMGKENIEKGEQSTVVGFFLVVLFMLIYYRFFGFVADMALLVNLIFIVAVMSVLHATMTLPGIAGIVLTIGMAVDANVLINERIREELRLGMTPQAAISAGYGRAFSTIVDANVTTLIVAVVLFGIGSGPVKSFAITLIIGLLTSMLSAIFFTRSVVNLHYGYRVKLKKLSIGIRVKE